MNTEDPTPQRLLYSTDQTADILGVSRTTIYRLTLERKLQVVKIGSRSLITAESVRSFIDGNRAA